VILRAGLVQLRSGRDMARNLADTAELIRQAAGQGAALVATPEMTNILEPDRPRLRGLAKLQSEDESVAGFSALAAELGIWLNIGSLALMGDDGSLINRSLLFDPAGTLRAHYDKIHLFDVDLPTGESLRESQAYRGGSRAVVLDAARWRLGLTICYDVRFPGLFRQLAKAGAEVITVPSAFTVPTGEAHWHVLLRARAIETGCFILAAAQGGRHESRRETFGHSLAVGPWGGVLAEAGQDPCAIVVDLDLAEVAAARRRIPALTHDRPFALQNLKQ
jgi:predicted amidohydrolase